MFFNGKNITFSEEANMRNSNSKTWLKPGTRQCLLRRALIKSMGYTDADL